MAIGTLFAVRAGRLGLNFKEAGQLLLFFIRKFSFAFSFLRPQFQIHLLLLALVRPEDVPSVVEASSAQLSDLELLVSSWLPLKAGPVGERF